MARKAPLNERLVEAANDSRCAPQHRELLAEAAETIRRLTVAHYGLQGALAIADRTSLDPGEVAERARLWDERMDGI
jgi:hypothetical protein